MASCRVCMADLLWAVDEAGAKVPLDAHEQLDRGAGRWRIVRDGNPPLVAAVAVGSSARSYVDHRELCQQPRPL